ncbi:MAG: hypothetical protein PWQ10_616 [Patescibacteria group bacterium]|nr:hypothetical protein [Patescibacteria group bacterium]
MNIPKFTIGLNQALDQDQFIEFFLKNDPSIKKDFPQIKNVDDIKAAIRYVYSHQDEHIGRGLKILKDNIDTLNRLAEIIGEKLDYDWDGISEITINPCSFPVCPRFIETSSFMVTYYFDKSSIIGICAHEMTHILYFKKIKDSLPNEEINTECPSKDWLLSEIFVQYITNSKEIQAITNFKDNLYITEDTKVTDDQLNKIKNLYIEKHDLLVFRSRVIEIL